MHNDLGCIDHHTLFITHYTFLTVVRFFGGRRKNPVQGQYFSLLLFYTFSLNRYLPIGL